MGEDGVVTTSQIYDLSESRGSGKTCNTLKSELGVLEQGARYCESANNPSSIKEDGSTCYQHPIAKNFDGTPRQDCYTVAEMEAKRKIVADAYEAGRGKYDCKSVKTWGKCESVGVDAKGKLIYKSKQQYVDTPGKPGGDFWSIKCDKARTNAGPLDGPVDCITSESQSQICYQKPGDPSTSTCTGKINTADYSGIVNAEAVSRISSLAGSTTSCTVM
jgi:hypothetical protein